MYHEQIKTSFGILVYQGKMAELIHDGQEYVYVKLHVYMANNSSTVHVSRLCRRSSHSNVQGKEQYSP